MSKRKNSWRNNAVSGREPVSCWVMWNGFCGVQRREISCWVLWWEGRAVKWRERMSHAGTHMIILCSDSGWAPPFCQKMELESERYNLDLEPNTNFRYIWVIVGIEIWVMSYELWVWVMSFEIWVMSKPNRPLVSLSLSLKSVLVCH